MKKLALLLIAIVLVFGSCTDRDDDLSGVNIRIKNDSNINFNSVAVGGSDEVYENISSGGYSEYLEYETAYRYNSVYIESDSTSYNYSPIDFVGEDSLNFGFYTYELSISEEGEVDLVFKVD
ncbi:hypothetical protein [Aurantibacter sp.]|uniref:hypothetical protein n=1 Tax=Aurantibacter sp. TaxID=2807103 RepID=UPI0032644654